MPVKLVCPNCGTAIEMAVAAKMNCPRCRTPMTAETSGDAPRPLRRAKSVDVMADSTQTAAVSLPAAGAAAVQAIPAVQKEIFPNAAQVQASQDAVVARQTSGLQTKQDSQDILRQVEKEKQSLFEAELERARKQAAEEVEHLKDTLKKQSEQERISAENELRKQFKGLSETLDSREETLKRRESALESELKAKAEQAENDLRLRMEAHERELTEAAHERVQNEARKMAEDAKVKADELLKNAEDECRRKLSEADKAIAAEKKAFEDQKESLRKEAEEKLETLRKAAEAEADAIRGKAREDAAAIQSSHENTLKALQEKLDSCTAECATAKAQAEETVSKAINDANRQLTQRLALLEQQSIELRKKETDHRAAALNITLYSLIFEVAILVLAIVILAGKGLGFAWGALGADVLLLAVTAFATLKTVKDSKVPAPAIPDAESLAITANSTEKEAGTCAKPVSTVTKPAGTTVKSPLLTSKSKASISLLPRKKRADKGSSADAPHDHDTTEGNMTEASSHDAAEGSTADAPSHDAAEGSTADADATHSSTRDN